MDFHEEDAVFDAGLAAYLLQPNQSEYEHDTLAKVYLDVTLPSEKEMLGKEKLGYFSFEDERVQKWMAYQAIVPYKIKSVLREKLKETGMESLYDEMELPCLYALYEMEKNGIRVDGEALHQYGEKNSVHGSRSLPQRFMQWRGKNLTSILRKNLARFYLRNLD